MKRVSPIGTVTIITAIMVLCMTVFAALAYSSGMAEYRLSKSGAEAVEAYYAADRIAAKTVAEAMEQEEAAVTEDIPAGTRQTLHIEVEIDGGKAHIIEWRTVADAEEEEVMFFD